ncbi:ABC transporter substrate-binding protein [Hoeflea sp. WL0058]|uniref:ABC transporter substrate-binding protein n=1 Tax=Flavimaribacter sediminis TaxID=2865987 RepID=A0AAE3D1V5_9HYPH|nr:ABC transporter substrate-binding protein [Flavimaribacter sediminis]MBW8639294.1 ABC transporter substrate-binding protein [Flavimaribacter sediminis]
MTYQTFTRRTVLTIGLAASLSFPAGAEDTKGGVVAIGGSVTEIIYALGEQDQLVARDTTSMFPPEANALPDVGYIRALSPEGVLSVNPRKIVALEGSGPPESLDVLKKASVPIVIIPESYSREGIVNKINAVGEAIGAEDKAADLAKAVEADIAAAESRAADQSERKRVLFILSMQGGRIMAAGDGTGAAAIIEMAGGVNALSGVAGYKQVSDEAVIEAVPDVILMMDRTGNHAADDGQLLSHPALAGSPAAESHKVVRMSGGYLLGFGPRTASAIEELSAALQTTD